MAVKQTASEAYQKWAVRLKGSTQQIEAGVDRVTEAPGVAAAKSKEKMRARLLAKIDDGTWEKRVSAVPLDEWRSKMKNKGIGRIAAGVDAAQSQSVDFFTQLFEHQNRGLSELDNMPNVTPEDNKARMLRWFDIMSDFRKK